MIQFIAAIKSLGIALELLKEVVSGAKAFAAWIEANKNEKWFQDSAATFSEWRKAKTPEEKKRAAEELRDLIRRL